MTTAFATETTIAADTATVWQRLTDWSTAPSWMAGVDDVVADGPTVPGTELTFAARGRHRTTTIVEVVDGRRVVLRSTQGPVTAEYAYEVEPDGDGSLVTLVADCTVHGPLRLVGPLVRRTLARTDGDQPDALREVVETR